MRRLLVIAAVLSLLVGGTVTAAPNPQMNAFQLFVLEARTDLELLANHVMGVGRRIESWTFNADLTSLTVVADLWYDNEQLADTIFGTGVRPGGWLGATTSDYVIIARNIRHDLEMSADEIFGINARPDTWIGASPVYQCDRTLQNTARLLDVLYSARPQTPHSVFNYCETLRVETVDELLPVMYNTVEPGSQGDDVIAAVSTIRGDLERLANELWGVNGRVEGWVGSLDEESPTFAEAIFEDMAKLADQEIGVGSRPDGWKMFVSTSLIIANRNMRYDLERLADVTLGKGVRPHGWQGVDPMFQCDLIEQGLVTLLQRRYAFILDEAVFVAPDFCTAVIESANHLAENPPPPSEEDEDMLYVAESDYAFAYLDPAALDYMGIMPKGTQFRAWYRNFSESTMMFVSGQNFAVFIDMRWTTLNREIFNTLPTLENVRPLTFCDAPWCNGPSPTPTPTGGGPLMAVITHATPIATISAGAIDAVKTQVSWNHVRVTYLLDRPETGTVQVALEICATPQQLDCEPVVNLYDNATGSAKPVLSQFNGLNVYELRYGYSSNLLVEGATRVSPDIWISDPTLR